MGLSRDPRHYQIAVLASLLAYGLFFLDFEISRTMAGVILVAVLGAQYACSNIWKIPRFDPRSALISGLSLCLLLRTNSIPLAILAATITISSKFVLRCKG